MALYSLFERTANRQYKRLSENAYSKHTAVMVFQNQLFNGAMSGHYVCLRPVRGKVEPTKVHSNLCVPCQKHLHTKHIRYFGCKCTCTMVNGE